MTFDFALLGPVLARLDQTPCILLQHRTQPAAAIQLLDLVFKTLCTRRQMYVCRHGVGDSDSLDY